MENLVDVHQAEEDLSAILAPDVLWIIFAMNANIFVDDNVLDTLRKTSQVCQLWRSIIVGSPTLWAQAIDLNALFPHCDCQDPESDECQGVNSRVVRDARRLWMNEVIRRTKTVSLWIKGRDVDILHQQDLQILHNLLTAEWGRISKLVVTIIGWRLPTASTKLLNQVIQRPAPCLQECNIQVMGRWRDDDNSPLVNVFGGIAPLLTNLTVTNFHIDPQATWLSNIQQLNIYHPPVEVVELLNILKRMVSLRSLRINDCFKTSSMGGLTIPFVHISSLTNIRLSRATMEGASFLLSHMHPSPGSSLYLNFSSPVKIEIDHSDFNSIPDFAERFLNAQFPKHLKFKLFPHSFYLELLDGIQEESTFYFIIDRSVQRPRFADAFIGVFSLPELSCITELDLTLQLEHLAQVPEILYKKLAFALTNVHALNCSIFSFLKFFETFFATQLPERSKIFPNLHTLNIYGSDSLSYKHTMRLRKVLQELVAEGRNLSLKSMGEFDRMRAFRLLVMLDDVAGLTIICSDASNGRTVEYICGSDQVEFKD